MFLYFGGLYVLRAGKVKIFLSIFLVEWDWYEVGFEFVLYFLFVEGIVFVKGVVVFKAYLL